MTCSEWLSSEKAITKSRKNYSHFDYRVDLSNCKDYISDPNKVAEHGFYPFIHYKKQTIKYNGKTRQKKTKNRDICYAAHLDRCIYQYYSYILNELYNSCVYQNGISDVPIAYRTDLGKSNIYFAHKAYEYIRTHKPCYIMIGDFTGFFDNLDHSYLKQMWCQLIGCPCLPQDHYNIYKNVTKYSTWDRSDILALNGLEDNQKGIDKLNSALKNCDDVYSVFLGDGGLKPDCDNILFCGKVNNNQVALYLNAADAFVLPTKGEGCCNAIIEALACGLPVISSDLAFNDDVLNEKNSIRINVEDEYQIADAINKLKEDTKQREMLVQGSVDSSKSLSISERAKHILEFMRLI